MLDADRGEVGVADQVATRLRRHEKPFQDRPVTFAARDPEAARRQQTIDRGGGHCHLGRRVEDPRMADDGPLLSGNKGNVAGSRVGTAESSLRTTSATHYESERPALTARFLACVRVASSKEIVVRTECVHREGCWLAS